MHLSLIIEESNNIFNVFKDNMKDYLSGIYLQAYPQTNT